MTRIIKETAVRRTEILEAARTLVYTRGYEQMTIQEIIDALHISKGAFYHYFDSKQALLEALIEHIQAEAEQVYLPILQDATLPAIEKLQRLFVTIGRWKTAQKEFMLALLRVWYTDENAIVRQKLVTAMTQHVAPQFSAVICQGIQEGVFNTAFPEQAGELIFPFFIGLGDAFASLLLSTHPPPDALEHIWITVCAYADALERILGAPPGSIQLMDKATLQEWMVVQGRE